MAGTSVPKVPCAIGRVRIGEATFFKATAGFSRRVLDGCLVRRDAPAVQQYATRLASPYKLRRRQALDHFGSAFLEVVLKKQNSLIIVMKRR